MTLLQLRPDHSLSVGMVAVVEQLELHAREVASEAAALNMDIAVAQVRIAVQCVRAAMGVVHKSP
jgi:hypothetical protein